MQIFTGYFRQPAMKYNAMPLGTLLWLAGLLVFPLFRCCHSDVCHHVAIGKCPGFRIVAQITHQDHFVHTA